MTKRVFGVSFSPLDTVQLADLLAREAVGENEGARLIVTTNADHIVQISQNREFREACVNAWAATADGAPVYLYAKWRGASLPGRVPGPDLFAQLMHKLVPGQHRLFFVVSNRKTGQLLQGWLSSRGFEDRALQFVCPPFGFEKDEVYSAELTQSIREHGTTHLIMGVGAPKSEVWVYRNRQMLGNCYALGIGAGVDFFVGVETRAPAWMRRIGMEWFWRFLREPRRLFRRYFITSWKIWPAVLADLCTSGTQGAAR